MSTAVEPDHLCSDATIRTEVFWGVDCGSAEIKVAAIDREGRLLTTRKCRTLFPLVEHVHRSLAGHGDELSAIADSDRARLPDDGRQPTLRPGHKVFATGYGRHHIGFVQGQLTEIKAHYLGVQHQLGLQQDYTIIDIGGQDAKVISATPGRVEKFAINRKCAAGTGAYIEELAHRLEVPMHELPRLAAAHDKDLTLNSYCTVFSGQEVIKLLMQGERVENLIHAMYRSVVKRVLEMTAIDSDTLVFSGGVMSHHSILMPLFAERFDAVRTILAPHAQFCGALGAAIHGVNEEIDDGLPNHQ
ncbi:MAG TPA: acyl-CoA dehydratase activase [Rhodanobacter sp.]|nr:acyl-CoA dehydratase activase [Rhodanobacter sp.]